MSETFASAAQKQVDLERKAWLLVGFTWIAYCLNYSDRQVIFSSFPILKSELQFTDTQLGLTGSVFLWVYGLCSPIAGQIGERFSKRRLVALSLLRWSGVTALTGLSHSVGMVLTCRALTGITESLFVPAAAVVVDVGAPLSHAVIVSRELGIPCVVSATGATKRIPDGARVRVDGNTGIVTVL